MMGICWGSYYFGLFMGIVATVGIAYIATRP